MGCVAEVVIMLLERYGVEFQLVGEDIGGKSL